ICQLTAGLPLALELAASWARLLSVPEIASELRQDLALLTAQHADDSRQQSIQHIFTTSLQQLSDEQQTTLLALSVFQAGWTVDAAKAVTGAHLPLLLRLSNTSLLQRGNTNRFDLHPLLKQFLQARAAHHPRLESWQSQHAGYFLDRLTSLTGKALSQFLDVDFDNVRSAWLYTLEHRPETLLTALSKLVVYIETTGRAREGLGLIEAAMSYLEACPDLTDELNCLLGCLQAEQAYLQLEQNQGELTTATFEHALNLVPERYVRERADIKLKFSFFYKRQRNVEQRIAWAQAALADVQDRYPAEQGICLRHLAGGYNDADDHDKATHCYQKSIDLLETSQHSFDDGKRQLGITLLNYGFTLYGPMHDSNRQHYDSARRLYMHALNLFQDVGFDKGTSAAHNNLAAIDINNGAYDSARSQLAASLQLSKRLQHAHHEVLAYINLVEILVREDALTHPKGQAEAVQLLTRARDLTVKRKLTGILPQVAMHYARVYSQLGCQLQAAQLLAAIDAYPATDTLVKRSLNKLQLEAGIDTLPEPTLSLDALAPSLGINLPHT
ncbi:MAG: hypothetical protein AAF708_16170, partial [Deinococcota bacterium]